MTPLSEISKNVQAGSTNRQEKRHDDSNNRPATSVPHNAIQGMLRTTTELGEADHLSLRVARPSHPSLRNQSFRTRSGSSTTSLAATLRHERSAHLRRHARPRGPRPAISNPSLSARYTSRSNLSSYTASSRGHGYREEQPRLQPHGPVRPATGPRAIDSTHSLATLNSIRDIRSMHPNSPSPQDITQRRTGYRTSSPVSSDWRSLGHVSRPGYRRAPSTGTLASSPASMYPRRRGIPGYRWDMSGSYASLPRYNSPALLTARDGIDTIPRHPLRTPTPGSAFRDLGPNVPRNPTPLSAISRSPTESPAPQYYDYSEAFVEENCFSPDGLHKERLPPLTLNQTILEDVPMIPERHAQTPFGVRQGSSFAPVEMATVHNRRPSESSEEAKRPNSSKHSKRPEHLKPPPHFFGRDAIGLAGNSGAVAAEEAVNDAAFNKQAINGKSVSGASPAGEIRGKTSPAASPDATIPSSPSNFFQNAARSSRDLATLAARVHSPSPDIGQVPVMGKALKSTDVMTGIDNYKTQPVYETSPAWKLPALTFRPISFSSFRSSPSLRPRTTEAAQSTTSDRIISPTPIRPMSSQSRKRFSKILGPQETFDMSRAGKHPKPLHRSKTHTLDDVQESLEQQVVLHPSSQQPSDKENAHKYLESPFSLKDYCHDNDMRISEVTSHDKSTIESLLDKHIECLGLTPEAERRLLTTSELDQTEADGDTQKHERTARLTDMLATVPSWDRGRLYTSSSQRFSSLASTDKRHLKPRRLFASMDARTPEPILEQQMLSNSVSCNVEVSRPSSGWQTLPSSSLHQSLAALNAPPSVLSGELADIDTSGNRSKFKLRRKSNLSLPTSANSPHSKTSEDLLKQSISTTTPRRSKTEMLARQASHRRRRIRIMLKLRERSNTLDNPSQPSKSNEDRVNASRSLEQRPALPHNTFTSAVQGYAELSADSIGQSGTHLRSRLSFSPPIPTRWSSIIAAMPEPVKKGAQVLRKGSVRTVRSHRSNNSIVEPLNSTRLNKDLFSETAPRLAPPELGPPLLASNLDLNVSSAGISVQDKPALRATRSFFSDDSSTKLQRVSMKRKLHVPSLRNVLPVSSGGSSLALTTPRQAISRFRYDHSCQNQGRKSQDSSSLLHDVVAMSDCTYRKRKVIGRLRDWWRRQCVPKVLSIKRRGQRMAPGGVW